MKAHSAALAVTQNALVASNQKRIVELVAKNRLPAIFTSGNYVVSGGLMSYGADQVEPFRRAASMVHKILKGTKPAGSPCRAANQVRADHQSQGSEANRPDDSA